MQNQKKNKAKFKKWFPELCEGEKFLNYWDKSIQIYIFPTEINIILPAYINTFLKEDLKELINCPNFYSISYNSYFDLNFQKNYPASIELSFTKPEKQRKRCI